MFGLSSLLLIVPNVERRAEFSLLNLPSFHPCCFGCVNSGGPLFHFNRGHRADTRGLLSHTQSDRSLTDNVAHKVRKNEEEEGCGDWGGGGTVTRVSTVRECFTYYQAAA